MKDAKTFWDNSAEKYVKSPIKDQASYEKKLALSRQYFTTQSRLLEFGCGSGATSIEHSPFVKSILATDISDKMIALAKQRALDANIDNISFQQGTLESIQLNDMNFDAVLGLNVLHLIEDVDGTIDKVYKLLDDQGVFISSTSLMGEVNIVFRWLISAMQSLGLAPYVSQLSKKQLIDKLTNAGFSIEYKWQRSYESIFIIARKTVKE